MPGTQAASVIGVGEWESLLREVREGEDRSRSGERAVGWLTAAGVLPSASDPQSTHYEYLFLSPDTDTKNPSISIEAVRELKAQLIFTTPAHTIRLVLIAPADRLTLQAQQALLKTLEEPPARTYLLLLTTQPQVLLTTIHSRCLSVPLPSANSPGTTAPSSSSVQAILNQPLAELLTNIESKTLDPTVSDVHGWLTTLMTALEASPSTTLFKQVEATKQLLADLSQNCNTKLALSVCAFSLHYSRMQESAS